MCVARDSVTTTGSMAEVVILGRGVCFCWEMYKVIDATAAVVNCDDYFLYGSIQFCMKMQLSPKRRVDETFVYCFCCSCGCFLQL